MKLESPFKRSDWKRFLKEIPLAILVLLLMMLVARFMVLAIVRWIGS